MQVIIKKRGNEEFALFIQKDGETKECMLPMVFLKLGDAREAAKIILELQNED